MWWRVYFAVVSIGEPCDGAKSSCGRQSPDTHVLTLSLLPPRTRAQGTDGRKYVFLAKPKDDLRRDSRVMEFQSLMNMLLRKDAGAFRFALLSRCLGVGDGCEGWDWSPACVNGIE